MVEAPASTVKRDVTSARPVRRTKKSLAVLGSRPGKARSPEDVASVSARLGVYAMELLINQVIKLGAARPKLVAKVFGGGKVLEGLDTLNVGLRDVCEVHISE